MTGRQELVHVGLAEEGSRGEGVLGAEGEEDGGLPNEGCVELRESLEDPEAEWRPPMVDRYRLDVLLACATDVAEHLDIRVRG